ncbi:hypothetical protein [Gordonia sp. VNK21]|uniref:hypothetical protein n=1 Tax=Gordonia sp. VNK21 TaxID=3382483 RepID=UPI0038D43EFF
MAAESEPDDGSGTGVVAAVEPRVLATGQNLQTCRRRKLWVLHGNKLMLVRLIWKTGQEVRPFNRPVISRIGRSASRLTWDFTLNGRTTAMAATALAGGR